MKNTIIVVSTNREMQRATRECIAQMRRAGAQYVEQSGCSDVALARCMSLTGACNALRLLNEPDNLSKTRGPFDTILMVDDDMHFSVDQAQELVNHTRAHCFPASAVYATMQGTIAAQPWAAANVGNTGRQIWKSGLGLLAVPSALVLELEKKAPKFQLLSGTCSAFTASGFDPSTGSWSSEDFTLCERLGGVHILPIAVGHIKQIPLYPDDATIASIRTGVPLPERLSAAEIAELGEGPVIARNPQGDRG